MGVRTYGLFEKSNVISNLGGRNITEREPTTANMDRTLKTDFKKYAHLHGKTYSDLLDEGAKNALDKLNLKELHEIEIANLEAEIAEIRAHLLEVEHMEAVQIVKQVEEIEPHADDREAFFKRNRNNLLKSHAEKTLHLLNYTAMIKAGGFRGEKEALEWTRLRCEKECSIKD